MSLEIRFYAERPNTNVDFWWDSQDEEIIEFCNFILEVANSLGITHSTAKSEDGLSMISTFTVNSKDDWTEHSRLLGEGKILESGKILSMQSMVNKRYQYFTNANHTLTTELFDNSTNESIFKTPLILMI
jgi:hypothetical protein